MPAILNRALLILCIVYIQASIRNDQATMDAFLKYSFESGIASHSQKLFSELFKL
jgi:hypothetical protein